MTINRRLSVAEMSKFENCLYHLLLVSWVAKTFDAILEGDIDGKRLWKMVLTPLVPYAVSTLSSVSAIRGQRRSTRPPQV